MHRLQRKIQSTEAEQAALLQQPVRKPVRNSRGPYTKGDRIYYAGAWRSKEAVERRRRKEREDYSKKYRSDEFREYERKRSAKKRALNPERERAHSIRHYHKNREKLLARRKQWTIENRERQNAGQRRRYRESN